jgi:kinesin family protein 3/17
MHMLLAQGGAAGGGGGGRDPTNIGTLRDSVAFNQAEDEARRRAEAAMPKARGLVKDTVDPRLRKSVAR